MSDIQKPAACLVLELLPNEIHTNPRYNVRPFSSEATTQEDQKIEELALSIESLGQLDAIIITPAHELIAGHRRRKAVIVINERRSARGKSLLRLHCVVDQTGGDYRRKAIQSNLQRKEQSAMDLAYLIAQVRKENDWDNSWHGTRKVATYLGCSYATVTEHEKFLCAEKELQNKIHDGTISRQSALELLRQVPNAEAREKVIERATQIQDEESLEKILENHKAGKTSLKEATERLNQNPAHHIQRPAIIAAIRERHTVTKTKTKQPSRSRSELIEAVEKLDIDGAPETARAWARYFVRYFATGHGSQDELFAKFIAIGPDIPRRKSSSRAVAS